MPRAVDRHGHTARRRPKREDSTQVLNPTMSGTPLSHADDVQLAAAFEAEAAASGEVLVDGGPAARPSVVVVDHEASADGQQGRDPREAGHRRLVPVTIEVSQ